MQHIGMDVHKESTVWHVVNSAGHDCGRGIFPTAEQEVLDFLDHRAEPARFYFEASASSAWLHRLLVKHGRWPVVVDPARNKAVATSSKKTDKHDAAALATIGRANLYEPVYVRSEETDALRRVLVARSGLVNARADLVRIVRAFFLSQATPLPGCKTDRFAQMVRGSPLCTWTLALVVKPMLDAIQALTDQISGFDDEIHLIAKTRADVVSRLADIPGIGEQNAVAFLLYVEDPDRFTTAGQVSAALGLVPTVRESAGKRADGRITKRGKKDMRKLLIQAAWAHVRSKEDTALKRWTERLMKKGGKAQRKKAVTALARKLAELMWTLWRRGTTYQPFPRSSRQAPPAP